MTTEREEKTELSDNEHNILSEVRDGVAIWTMNRPSRRNALSRAVVRELARLARSARDDSGIRAVIITGSGEQAFCAGADLKERQTMSEEDVRDFLPLYRRSFGAIDRLNKPVFAAMNGAAYGGGLELALACDFRVLSRKAQLGLTETSLAIIPAAGGTQRLTRLIGEAKAKELILFAKRLSAEESLELGLVHRLNEEGESALDTALGWASHFRSAAPIAVAAAMEAIDATREHSQEAALSIEARCYHRTLASEDRLEALAAFKEKRPPRFHGR